MPDPKIRPNQIARFRKLKGLSRDGLARASGVSFGQITKLERRERNLRLETAKKLSAALGCNWRQLFGAGVDQAGRDVDPEVLQDFEPEAARPGSRGRPDMIEVPEVDPNAMAGDETAIDISSEHLQEATTGLFGFPAASFRDMFGGEPGRVVIIPVKGDSMAPTFTPGQRVLVDLTDRKPSPPGVFVLWDGLGSVIKRVEFIPFSDPGRVRIMSDNSKHAPYERLLNEAYIQGRVIGAWERC
jgi:phage repressor protein C with HTH and peptisase S24 domain